MGVYYCSTGKHIAFISVSPMQAFECECPKEDVRALYRRLADAYSREPLTPKRRSGAVGDRYPL